MKKLFLALVAMAFMSTTAHADDFDKTGLSGVVQSGDISIGYATGASRDFDDEADVFSLGYSGLPVDLGLQVISNGSTDDYRLNVGQRADLTLLNVNIYGVAEVHYDFGDSFTNDRLVLSPVVGVEFGAGSLTPYAELGYDISSIEGDWFDFNRKDSYIQVGAKLDVSDKLAINAGILQKSDKDFDSLDREFVLGFNYKL